MPRSSSDTPLHNERAYWSGVFAMTLCVFTLIASEFMPVSLLTPISADLAVSEGLVGQGIAISGLFAVLTSLSISTLAGAANRKILLLGMTALMALSGAIIALAPSYFIYMAGRALIGIAIGGFWSLSAATAIRLVPQHRVPRALAIFNGGNALATVIAAPLGSYLGSVIGWRGASEQRFVESKGGDIAYIPGTVNQLDDSTSAIQREFFDFYRTSRGGYTPKGEQEELTTKPMLSSIGKFMNFYPFNDIETISPRPMLFITGSQAHSKEFSEDAYQGAGQPKELYIVPGAGHVDLYDRTDLIPFAKLTSFFKTNLK